MFKSALKFSSFIYEATSKLGAFPMMSCKVNIGDSEQQSYVFPAPITHSPQEQW